MHGASGTDPKVYMGGGNNALRNLIWDKLESIGIVCEVPGNNIAGIEPKNIANRTRTGGGVQLELTTALRSSLFADNNSGRANRKIEVSGLD
nr:poly-gamma-glutamate hydrolase [Staphylococcus phage S-CoN_Ph38]